MKIEPKIQGKVGIILLLFWITLAPILGIYFGLLDSDILKGNLALEDPAQDFPGAGGLSSLAGEGFIFLPFSVSLLIAGCRLLELPFHLNPLQRLPVLRC